MIAAEPPGNAGSGSARTPRLLVPLLLFVATVAAHVALATRMRAPIIHTDEFAYLDIARYLAHGGLRPRTVYYPGYSLVLAPLALATRDPLTLYRAALGANAFLAGLTTLAVWALVPRLAPGTSWRLRALMTVVVAAYPMFLLGSDLAMSENLFIPAFLGLALLLGWAFRRPGAGRFALLGLAGGAVAAVHPRGYAVDVALAVIVLVGIRPLRRWWVARVAFLVGLGVTVGAGRWLVDYVSRGSTSGAYRTADIVGRAGSVANLGSEVAGHLLYALVATFGLAGLGLAVAARRGWVCLRGRGAVPDVVAAFCGVAFVGVLGLSSLYLTNATRLDHYIYGRYEEAVLAPLLVLGVVVAARVRLELSRHRAVICGLAVVIATLVAAGVVAAAHRHHTTGPLVRPNVMGVDVVFWLSNFRLNVGALAAFGVGGTVVALLAFRRRVWAGALVLLAGFAPSVVTASATMADGSAARSHQRVVVDALDAIEERFGGGAATGCVGYDVATGSVFHQANDRLFHPSAQFDDFDSRLGQRPCSDLVVSGRLDLAAAYPGARLVVFENNGPGYTQALWALPGPLQSRLDEAGWLLPPTTPGPLPEGARIASVVVANAGAVARHVRAGGQVALRVVVTHGGSGSPWPNAAGLGTTSDAVRLTARWYATADGGGPSVADQVVDLPHTLLPGQTVRIDVALTARAGDGSALARGPYRVVLQVEQQPVGPFTSSSPPAAVAIEVD